MGLSAAVLREFPACFGNNLKSQICYLEIKKFGIVHGNPSGKIELRNGYDLENKIMIGSQKE